MTDISHRQQEVVNPWGVGKTKEIVECQETTLLKSDKKQESPAGRAQHGVSLTVLREDIARDKAGTEPNLPIHAGDERRYDRAVDQ